MKSEFENYLIRKTVAETDHKLSKWTKLLVEDSNLEVGDDPSLVDNIEQDLRELAHRIRILKPQFDLHRVPIRQANDYYAATQQLDEAVDLVCAIRQQDYGSRHNTRQCLEKLTLCKERVQEITNILAAEPDLVSMSM